MTFHHHPHHPQPHQPYSSQKGPFPQYPSNASPWVSMRLNKAEWVWMSLIESEWVWLSLNESDWVWMSLNESQIRYKRLIKSSSINLLHDRSRKYWREHSQKSHTNEKSHARRALMVWKPFQTGFIFFWLNETLENILLTAGIWEKSPTPERLKISF